MNRLGLWFPIVAMVLCATGCSSHKRGTITQEELTRRTQELFDAVAGGDRGPWERYFAADCMFFDEKGRDMDKKALLADLGPLPPGYSGTIKLVRAQSRIFEDTALLSYDLDETETVFGQNLRARYHGTDTWLRRNGEWQIVAEQMFRYYEDPAPGTPDLNKEKEYAGTYELAPGKTLEVRMEGADLYSQKSGKAKELLVPEAGEIFFCKGVEGRRLFRRDKRGRVDGLIDRRNNEDLVWRKIK